MNAVELLQHDGEIFTWKQDDKNVIVVGQEWVIHGLTLQSIGVNIHVSPYSKLWIMIDSWMLPCWHSVNSLVTHYHAFKDADWVRLIVETGPVSQSSELG